MNAPYFHAKQIGTEIKTDGLLVCHNGHKVASSNGNIDGVFADWAWDGSRLVVHNDQYGFYPLYYYTISGEFGISTSIAKLMELGAPPLFDDAGMAVFLRLGFFIGEDTPFKGIRALPRCHSFCWTTEGLQIELTKPRIKTTIISRSRAIDAYISLFRQSIQRRLATDYTLLLSGGKDSRHILFELCAAGHRPELCITSAKSLAWIDDDIAVAKELTATLNLRHVTLAEPHPCLEGELRTNLVTSFCSDEHGWFLPVADYLSNKTRTTYDGIGPGDVLSAAYFTNNERLAMFRAGKFTELAVCLLDKAKESIPEGILAAILPLEEYRRFNRELATEHLSDELKLHAEAPDPVGAFYLANRTRREIALAPYALLANIENVYSPYLDHDLYDFLSSLPAEMLIDHKFHLDTILRAYPEYSRIPYAENSRLRLKSSKHFRRFALDLLRYAVRHLPLQFVRHSFLLPRLARALVDAKYSYEVSWFGQLTTYLIQLQTLTEGDSYQSIG